MVTLLGIGVSITLWKTYESLKHLQAFRDLAFQRTMNAAILGDREFLEGFVQAEDVNIAEEWRHFFHGLVCYYDGRMNEAVSDFTRSLEIEENNMAACQCWPSVSWRHMTGTSTLPAEAVWSRCRPERTSENTTASSIRCTISAVDRTTRSSHFEHF